MATTLTLEAVLVEHEVRWTEPDGIRRRRFECEHCAVEYAEILHGRGKTDAYQVPIVVGRAAA